MTFLNLMRHIKHNRWNLLKLLRKHEWKTFFSAPAVLPYAFFICQINVSIHLWGWLALHKASFHYGIKFIFTQPEFPASVVDFSLSILPMSAGKTINTERILLKVNSNIENSIKGSQFTRKNELSFPLTRTLILKWNFYYHFIAISFYADAKYIVYFSLLFTSLT